MLEELEAQVIILTLLNGLQPGPFKSLLSKGPTRTFKEIQIWAKKYIFLEEIEKATANSGRNQSKKKTNAYQEEHLRKKAQMSSIGNAMSILSSTCPLPMYTEELGK